MLPEVGVVVLKAGTVDITNELNGRAVPYLVAEVRPQVNGIVQKRLFVEGSNVKENVQLYQIDPAMYDAQLNSAKAVLDKANANANVAKTKKRRYDELLQNKAIAQQEWDEVNAAYLQAEAEIGIADAEAKIAQINVDYTKVFSPIAGRIGKSGVTEGALVTANQAEPLATIQQLDPIYVDVSQSTTGMLQLRQALDKGLLTNTGEGHGKVTLTLENGMEYAHEGVILFSDVTVDQSTGSISLRTQFPNPDWELMPGMYVTAKLTVAQKDNAITVPQQSLLRNPDGSAYVYVVGPDDVVEKRPVITMQAIKDQWLIADGLQAGEKVVFDGIQRIYFSADGKGPKVKVVQVETEK